MYVLITGGSKGIGYAIAKQFASCGHNLILISRNGDALAKAAAALQAGYAAITVHYKSFDLSVAVKEAGAWVVGLNIIPDVVINNAGVFEPGKVYNEPDGLLENQMASNLYSAYYLTRALLPKMMETNPLTSSGRHVFNICSIAGLKAYENGGAYSISKFAMDGFSKNLRHEMKGYNIKVTTVYPGAVLTDAWGNFDNSQHRIMEAADVAKMVYAASQLSAGACVEEIVMRPQLGDL